MIDLDIAIEILNSDEIIGIPTETVYGLGGKITSQPAIEKIFAEKDRPFFDPLIVHVKDLNQARTVARSIDPISEILARAFWPGSLTLILPKSDSVNTLITSGLDTVGVRVPNHKMTLELLGKLDAPLAAPSANKFKKTSPTKASHVRGSFPNLAVLDGGTCEVGIESTIVQCSEKAVKILRPGMITKGQITEVLRENNIDAKVEFTESPVAPGHMRHHYMPEKPLIVIYGDASTNEIPQEVLKNPKTYEVLSSAPIFARELYQKLRELDGDNTSIIFKLPKSTLNIDEWAGIINRLEKAATFTLTE